MSTRITVTLPDDLDEDLPYDEFDSKSATVVEYVRRGFDRDELKTENERLQRRVEKLIAMREEHTELVRHVEENRSLQQQKHEAGAATRLKWLLFGGDE